MLKVVVVDRTAESRNRIVAQIHDYLRAQVPDIHLMPQVNVKPLSPEELKFHANPDILILGEQTARADLMAIAATRKLLGQTPIMVRVDPALATLSSVEQIARLGADDVWSESASAEEFLRKLILLSRKVPQAKRGSLILVDSGKGGVGVTSIVAALGESLVAEGKTVALLDLDAESQDLSRFLQAKPYVNESLQLMLEQSRPITEEFVRQALVPVWHDEPKLFCIPPIPESDALYDSQSTYPRAFLAVLESLDSLVDVCIVDLAGTRSTLRRALHRVADSLLFVVSNDPAGFYASVEKLTKGRALLAADARVVVVENIIHREGLAHATLRSEFSRAAKLQENQWFPVALQHCKSAGRWPASGTTLFSGGTSRLSRSIAALGEVLLGGPAVGEQRLHESSAVTAFFQRLLIRLLRPRAVVSAPTLVQESARARTLTYEGTKDTSNRLALPVSTASLLRDGEPLVSKPFFEGSTDVEGAAAQQTSLDLPHIAGGDARIPSTAGIRTTALNLQYGDSDLPKLVSGARYS